MCGAPLGPPPAPLRDDLPRERVRQPVSGPSFLGLGDERSRDLDYLLEDEPPRGHGRLYLALLLLILSGALLAWHWQRDGYPWAEYIPQPVIRPSPAPAPVPPPGSTATTAAAPVTPVEPTANPAPPEAQPGTAEAAQPPAAEPAAGSSVPASPAGVVKPTDQAATPQAAAAQASPPEESPDSGEVGAAAPTAASSQTEEPKTPEPAPKEARAATVVSAPRPVGPKPSPSAPAQSFEDRLVADGEKYLYGRGVPEDCDRAQRNLQIAARQSNAKAQTLLGAMYATGHCVGRDLPTAYRWFARALHGDPGNSRVQRDLEVLWKQMTPEERLVAMKSQ